jgi:hypothetical protein
MILKHPVTRVATDNVFGCKMAVADRSTRTRLQTSDAKVVVYAAIGKENTSAKLSSATVERPISKVALLPAGIASC